MKDFDETILMRQHNEEFLITVAYVVFGRLKNFEENVYLKYITATPHISFLGQIIDVK